MLIHSLEESVMLIHSLEEGIISACHSDCVHLLLFHYSCY
jgi:hypothetical protein